MTTGNFRKGGDVAAEAAKKASASFARTQWFGLKDKESCIVRFLTDADAWITVDQHQQVPTKGKPEKHEGNWPERMGCICRRDQAFTGVFNDCYVCDHVIGHDSKVKKAGPRTWALACIREEVIEDGKSVGLRDKTREVTRKKPGGKDDETETIIEKDIVVVAMGWKNFWATLQGFAGHYGTVCDRDYKITRSGATTDTTYSIIPLDPITDGNGNKLVVASEWGKRYESDYDLGEIITQQASDEYFARFFDPRYTVTGEGADRKVVATGAAPEPKAENDVDEARLADLASRVRGYAGGDAAPPAETPAAPPAEAPAAPAASGGMKNFD